MVERWPSADQIYTAVNSRIFRSIQDNLQLHMWVPGNLPPNLIFLLVIARPGDEESVPRHAIPPNATHEAAHFQDAYRRQHAVDRQVAGGGYVVD